MKKKNIAPDDKKVYLWSLLAPGILNVILLKCSDCKEYTFFCDFPEI
jgi:hypothetical protein